MPEWAHPWGWAWLVAIPLVYWLHRRLPDPPRVPVSAAFLFEGAPAPEVAGRRARIVDARWRRRAAVFLALAAAAAGPLLGPHGSGPLTVWVDDAPSLWTLEREGARAALAARSLAEALAQEAPEAVTLRSLRDPGRALPLPPGAPAAASIEAWLAPSERSLASPALAPGERHWLVTDGADPAARRWAGERALARVVQVGRASDNAALVGLAVRRSPAARGRLDGVVRVLQTGGNASHHRVEIRDERGVVATFPVASPAGETSADFALPAGARGALDARLVPGDALALDDRLRVDLRALAPLALTVDGRCPPRVQGLLNAHPGLDPGLPAAADASPLLVSCDDTRPAAAGAWLWVAPARRGAAAPSAPPLWHPSAGALREIVLPRGGLGVSREDPPLPGTPLLIAGDAVLVSLARERPPGVAVRLDLADPRLGADPSFPALLAGLVDRAAERPVLDPIAAADRPAALAQIAPHAVRALPPSPAAPRPGVGRGLAPLLLALAAGLIAFDAWTMRHRRASLGARLAAAALLVAAVAGIGLLPLRAPLDLVVLLDASRSAGRDRDAATWSALRAAIGAVAPGSRLALVRFGAEPALELAPADVASDAARAILAADTAPRARAVDTGATDVAAAVAAGLHLASPERDTALLIATDGAETRGDAARALGDARRAGVTVLALDPPATAAPSGPRLVDVHAPALARAGERVPISALVETPAEGGTLVLLREGRAASSTPLAAGGHAPALVALELVTDAPGPHEFSVVARNASEIDTDARRIGVDVAGPPAVLHVGARDDAPLRQALAAGGWPVAHVAPGDLAQDPAPLARADLVVLDDVPAAALPGDVRARLARAVRADGAGLLVLGGPEALGSGASEAGALEEMLPLAPAAGGAPGALAIAFVLDKSGSMERDARGRARLTAAAGALRESARSLAPGDLVGLVAFDAEARELLPLAAWSDPAAALEGALRPEAGGGTRVGPALRLAADRLAAAPARERLVVLLSDGLLRPDEVAAEAAALADTQLRLLALAIGPDAETASLERLVAASRAGRVLRVADAAELPRALRGALAEARGAIAGERVATVRRAPLPFLPDRARFPDVLAFARTRARPDAQVWLATPEGDPLLATRVVGTARVAVLPAGLGAWAPGWLAGPDGARFSGGLAGWLARDAGSGTVELSAVSREDGAHLRIDASDATGGWLSADAASVAVVDAGGEETSLAALRVAPGRFEAPLPAAPGGALALRVRAGDTTVRRTLWIDEDVERTPAPDGSALGRWAEAGWLTRVPGAPGALTEALPRPRRPAPLRAALAALAGLLFLATLAAEQRLPRESSARSLGLGLRGRLGARSTT